MVEPARRLSFPKIATVAPSQRQPGFCWLRPQPEAHFLSPVFIMPFGYGEGVAAPIRPTKQLPT